MREGRLELARSLAARRALLYQLDFLKHYELPSLKGWAANNWPAQAKPSPKFKVLS